MFRKIMHLEKHISRVRSLWWHPGSLHCQPSNMWDHTQQCFALFGHQKISALFPYPTPCLLEQEIKNFRQPRYSENKRSTPPVLRNSSWKLSEPQTNGMWITFALQVPVQVPPIFKARSTMFWTTALPLTISSGLLGSTSNNMWKFLAPTWPKIGDRIPWSPMQTRTQWTTPNHNNEMHSFNIHPSPLNGGIHTKTNH